jgi:hypothetical protein
MFSRFLVTFVIVLYPVSIFLSFEDFNSSNSFAIPVVEPQVIQKTVSVETNKNFIAGFYGEQIDWVKLWTIYQNTNDKIILLCKIHGEHSYDSFYLSLNGFDFAHSSMHNGDIFRFDVREVFRKMKHPPYINSQIEIFGKNGALVQLVDWSILIVDNK